MNLNCYCKTTKKVLTTDPEDDYFLRHLNYLSEFETLEEKDLVLLNLGVNDDVLLDVIIKEKFDFLFNKKIGFVLKVENEYFGFADEDTKNQWIIQGSNLDSDLILAKWATNDLITDKNYNPMFYSGMGRKYLLMNIVDGINTLTQTMFKDNEGNFLTNTIFFIQYDYDLGGSREETLTFANRTNIVTEEYTKALAAYNKANTKYDNAVADLANKQDALLVAEEYLAELEASDTATEEEIDDANLAVTNAEIDVELAQEKVIEEQENRANVYTVLQSTQQYYSYNTVSLLAGECLYLEGTAVGLNQARTGITNEKGTIIYAEENMTVTIGDHDGTYNFKVENYVSIPSGCVLVFNGGSLRNGRLEGNNTEIVATKKAIFTGITIGGTWNVPEITTTWFSDATSENKLKDVLALQDEQVLNTITIEQGDYTVSATYSGDYILPLKSNLNLIINGEVSLLPNGFDAYYIFSIVDQSHINISGSGSIVGDKNDHTGETGQWGHGIFVQGKFVTIKDLTVKNCWGDSICVGKSKSQEVDIDDIIIDNCYLDGSRRQGISVTHGRNVIIRNCYITNIGVVRGHNPKAAIDIEPNDGNYAYNISIENCRIEDCMLGIIIYGRNYYMKSCISINNCYIKCKRRAFAVNGINTSVKITNCEAYTRFHAVDANTIDGTKDNVVLFENNIIKQHPEQDDDMSTDTRGCAIYAIKGDYCFRHNSIISTLPVFRFASGNKFIEDNDIECGDLFYPREVTGVRIIGNRIRGNVTIPGTRTIFENNNVDGLLKSTASYDVVKNGLTSLVKINDKNSIIRNNFITNVATGNATVAFRKRVVIDGNMFINVGLNMTEGIVANNRFLYKANFVPDGEIISGILLKVLKTDFVNNIINYNGSNPNNRNVYFVWCTKNIVGNEFVSASRIQYCFYHSNGCFISGNKITLPDEHDVNRIVDTIDCTIIPAIKNTGTTTERPILPADDRYYVGCKYFATDLGKPIFWNGTHWADSIGTILWWNLRFVLTNLLPSNDQQPAAGELFTTILMTNEGYSLPSTIKINMNNVRLTAGTDYTYDQQTGEVIILGTGGTGGVTGDIVIGATGVENQ